MGGVDRSDRMIRTYSVSRQSKKWWYRLFYYLLDTSFANSYILYQNSENHDDLSELEYLKQLSVALIGTRSRDAKVQPRPKRKKKKIAAPPRMAEGNHWPLRSEKRGKCQQCAPPKSRGPQSQYMCEACRVFLCISGCFKNYHTRR